MKIDTDRAYELTKAGLVPVTQAIDETETTVKYLSFGELVEKKIIPIEEACKTCTFSGKTKLGTEGCRKLTKEDAVKRGFQKLVCPNQFK